MSDDLVYPLLSALLAENRRVLAKLVKARKQWLESLIKTSKIERDYG
jgi:hypothetical protein